MGVTLSGLASGLDTNSLIAGLMSANSEKLNAMNTKKKELTSASSSISSIATALSSLKTATLALSSTTSFATYKTTTSDATAISVVADATATPGSYNVTVGALAREQRNYSSAASSPALDTTALNMSGSFTLKVTATGTATAVNVLATDTLQDIAGKINGLGLRATASIINTGTGYRLQVRGLDTGAANTLTFDETGMAGSPGGNLGLSNVGPPAACVQTPLDSSITLDTFTITRPTNDVTGAIPGVTLSLKQFGGAAVKIEVAPDVTAFGTKVAAVINAYNQTISACHVAAGAGTSTDALKNTNKLLMGDSAVRTVQSQLANWMKGTYTGAGALTTIGDIGIKMNSTNGVVDGSITLDQTKLAAVYAANPNDVKALFTRPLGATTGGAMATLADTLDLLNKFDTGVVPTRKAMFDSRAKKLDDDMVKENARLDRVEAALRKQFSEMESIYSKNQGQLSAAKQI